MEAILTLKQAKKKSLQIWQIEAVVKLKQPKNALILHKEAKSMLKTLHMLQQKVKDAKMLHREAKKCANFTGKAKMC